MEKRRLHVYNTTKNVFLEANDLARKTFTPGFFNWLPDITRLYGRAVILLSVRQHGVGVQLVQVLVLGGSLRVHVRCDPGQGQIFI